MPVKHFKQCITSCNSIFSPIDSFQCNIIRSHKGQEKDNNSHYAHYYFFLDMLVHEIGLGKPIRNIKNKNWKSR